ncbi:hypothetical protein ACLOJK_014910 [Asimina triloba]
MACGGGGGEQRREEVSPADEGFMLVGVGAEAGGASNGWPGSTDPGLSATETKADGYGRNRRRDDVLEENDLGIEVIGVAMERAKLGWYGRCSRHRRAAMTDPWRARCWRHDEQLRWLFGTLTDGGAVVVGVGRDGSWRNDDVGRQRAVSSGALPAAAMDATPFV